MPSFSQAITNNRIIISVSVALGPDSPRTVYQALLDTGAMITAISPKVVQDLQFLPTGVTLLTVANGQQSEAFEYDAWVDIPIQYSAAAASGQRTDSFWWGAQLPVIGLPYQPDDYDVILGMDLIGIFHVTLYGNRIILSN